MFIPSATIAPQSRAVVQISNIAVILIIPHFSHSQELCVSVCSVPSLYTPSHKAEVKVWNMLYLFMLAVGPGESSDQ